jgi:tetratricopeptide (TPR) repeat protein
LAALAVLLASALDPGGGLDGLTARLSGEAGLGRGGTEHRRHLWAGAWAAFRASPVHGVGVDGLFLAFGRHRTAAAWAAEWGETPLKAHNQVLEVLATRGLVGGAALALMLLGLGRDGLRALRGPDDGCGLARAAVAVLAAFFVHNLFHFPTAAGMTLAAVLAAVLSMLARRAGEGNDEERPASASLVLSTRAGLAALLAAAVALHAVVLTPLRADVLVQAATVVLRADPGRAVGLAREAVRLDPSRDLLWLRLSAALHSHGLSTTEPVARAGLLREAREAAERGVALVPTNAYAHAHLGTLLADLERETPPLAARDDVERAFGEGLALDPLNADIQMAAAHAALAAGDLAGARARAQACRDVHPRFAPPFAVLGAVALAEGRRLAQAGQAEAAFSQLQEAARLLDEALGGEWHGDERARAAAAANRAAVDARP